MKQLQFIPMSTVSVGILGLGTVGTGVVRALLSRKKLLVDRSGVELVLRKVAARHLAKRRSVRLDRSILTNRVEEILRDPQIDIVVELIGGIHPAKEYILRALQAGKHVVTANKALLAQEGKALFEAARRYQRELYFEASVGGGIPIVKAIREGFISNHVESLYAIINGTSNYILTQMTDKGIEFRQALREAQARGYAERNPRLDVNGDDAAHKLAILILLAFGQHIRLNEIYTEGLSRITANDLKYAGALGYTVKLLSIAKLGPKGLEARVHPTLVPQEHLLASVKGVYNAIYLKGDLIGRSLLYGRGAGQMPTTSAVIADLVDLARNIAHGNPQGMPVPELNSNRLRIRPIEELETRYYLRLSAEDRPGVLGEVARILGRQQISIASVIQQEWGRSRRVPVVMMTHEARERSVQKALHQIDRLPSIHGPSLAIRVEETDL